MAMSLQATGPPCPVRGCGRRGSVPAPRALTRGVATGKNARRSCRDGVWKQGLRSRVCALASPGSATRRDDTSDGSFSSFSSFSIVSHSLLVHISLSIYRWGQAGPRRAALESLPGGVRCEVLEQGLHRSAQGHVPPCRPACPGLYPPPHCSGAQCWRCSTPTGCTTLSPHVGVGHPLPLAVIWVMRRRQSWTCTLLSIGLRHESKPGLRTLSDGWQSLSAFFFGSQ